MCKQVVGPCHWKSQSDEEGEREKGGVWRGKEENQLESLASYRTHFASSSRPAESPEAEQEDRQATAVDMDFITGWGMSARVLEW